MFLARLLSAEGQASRWSWWIVTQVCAVATSDTARKAMGFDVKWNIREHESAKYMVIVVLYGLIFWVNLASGIKRLHDLGRSGWWMLLAILPPVSIIWLGLVPGHRGFNRFGAPDGGAPLGPRRPSQSDKITVAS